MSRNLQTIFRAWDLFEVVKQKSYVFGSTVAAEPPKKDRQRDISHKQKHSSLLNILSELWHLVQTNVRSS